jgi:hypothetical protein
MLFWWGFFLIIYSASDNRVPAMPDDHSHA